jgi:hypothetical protein
VGLDGAGAVYKYDAAGGQFTATGEAPLALIAASANGAVWGVTASGQVFQLDAAGTWVETQGSLDQVVVGADGAVWGMKAGSALYYR